MNEMRFKSFPNKVAAGAQRQSADLKPDESMQFMNQVHGTRVVELSGRVEAPEADALITRTAGLSLVVKTADCLPLVFADERSGWIAAVHAGWRGLTTDIVPLTLARLKEKGVDLAALKVGVGPSLGLCCSTFSRPFEEIPEKYHWAIQENGHVDLNGICERQLLDAGVPSKSVEWLRICTACSKDWPSWRRDQAPGRFWTWIRIDKA